MKSRTSRLRDRKRALALEPLELRQLLSAAVAPVWTIQGTPNNDVISVVYNPTTKNFDLTINGTLVESRPASRLRRVVINGGAGDDTLTVTTTGGKALQAVINGGAGNDTLTGGDGNDIINGGSGDDTVNGGAGNDALGGGAGNDTLNGGAGNDLLHGSTGSDALSGDAGNDYLYGDAGDDNLDGGEGGDHLFGNQGNDVLIGGAGKDALAGGSGTDTNYAVKGRDTFQRDRHDAVIQTDQPVRAAPVDGGSGAGSGDSSVLPPVALSPELKQRLIDEAVARYRNLLGTTYSNWWSYYPSGGVIALNNNITLAASSRGVSASPDHSDTNNQVQGVDEADLVETDGNFIYTVRNNALVVIDVRDPANAHIVSNVALDAGSVVGLYLVGSRVVVLSSTLGGYLFQPLTGAAQFISTLPTYRYQSQTTAWVFDVTDPANAALIEKTTMTGYLASSRVIGHQLYLVLGNDASLPAPQSTIVSSPPPDTTASSAIALPISGTYKYQYQTEAEYRQWLADNIDAYVPKFATTLADGTAGPSGALLGNIQYDAGTLGAITNLLDFDLTDDTPGPAALVTATGNPGTVYASSQNLYVCTSTTTSATNILKFNLANGSIAFDAAGQIQGTVSNSYAMDEFNGQLRVVTGDWSNWATHSLFILSDIAGQLAVTGSLTDIGNHESLRSVLFVQDRVFVVTFLTVDPLFAIDLSDPANPISRGELVTPGYSTYLYPLDRNHLIGIGRSPGTSLWHNSGVQVSLFDVSDLTHPTVVDQEIYPGSGTWGAASSTALYDPHAFSYFADQGVLAVPLSTSDWTTINGAGQNSLLVLKVNADTGFNPLGQVIQDSNVQRSLRIGETLYSLAEGDMKVVELLHPAHVLADVILPAAPPAIIVGRPIFLQLIATPAPIFSVSQPITITTQ